MAKIPTDANSVLRIYLLARQRRLHAAGDGEADAERRERARAPGGDGGGGVEPREDPRGVRLRRLDDALRALRETCVIFYQKSIGFFNSSFEQDSRKIMETDR